MYVPSSLTIKDKECIISKYLDSNNTNLNYVGIIENLRNKNDFKISDKIRLKAKRLHRSETEKMLSSNSMKYGVAISFPNNTEKLKSGYIDNDLIAHYSYSLDYILKYSDYDTLFQNFKILFEYVDSQNRINLVNKISQMGVLERFMGLYSSNDYRTGAAFSMNQMTSQAQIYGYAQVLNTLNIEIVDIIKFIYTSSFQQKYNYPTNAKFIVPSITSSCLEKIRILAPELESILKQFKIFVEDGNIDYELLQISSSPCSIKDIPSLNANKYLYLNNENNEIVACSNLFFSDQCTLSYVEPFKENKYTNFCELLLNEKVCFENYADYQKEQINYLIDKEFISIDNLGFIQLNNLERILILKDLNDNEVGAFYRYPKDFKNEVIKMESENIIFFDSSLFSKPEQSYFNYFLNKSEFTNGLDLRNSYLHGTQADPEDKEIHDFSYFTYLKLLILTMLKIQDYLEISEMNN